MIWSGVFERFPDLKLAITENGAFWVPDMLTTMDEAWVGTHSTLKFGDVYREALPEKPSFYFNRNCFIATQMSAREIPRRHEIGVDNILWGNDFPHPEGTWPHTRDWIRIRYHDVPEDEARKMLGRNALGATSVRRGEAAGRRRADRHDGRRDPSAAAAPEPRRARARVTTPVAGPPMRWGRRLVSGDLGVPRPAATAGQHSNRRPGRQQLREQRLHGDSVDLVEIDAGAQRGAHLVVDLAGIGPPVDPMDPSVLADDPFEQQERRRS